MIVSKGGSSSGFATGGFGKDTKSSDGLLELARSQGGAVAAAAEELVHPEKSMLSTISDGFKKGFGEFVDLISKPSQIVAGVISDEYSISEAMQEKLKVSDVIWGDSDPNASTLNKVGNFTVRFATDVLTDPLTYLTFGAGSGIAGLRALPKVTLGAKAAKAVGAEELAAKALTQEGADVLAYLRKVERQANGLDVAPELLELKGAAAHADSAFNMGREELETLLKQSIDSPQSMDFTKRAMRNLLEKAPQLADTLIDKGGIKFFGQQIMSGQRIHAAMNLVPGFKYIDHATQNFRRAVAAPFTRGLIKADGKYVRIPEEFLEAETKMRDLAKNLGDERLNELSNIVKANGLSTEEGKFLMASVEAGKMPLDERLANAYKQLLAFNENEYQFLKKMGANFSRLDNHVPHVLVDLEVKQVGNILPPTTKMGAGFKRKLTDTIFKKEGVEAMEEAVTSKDQKKIEEVFNGMKNMGMEIFDDNIISAHIKRTTDNVKAATSRDFIRSVAGDFGQLETLAPKGWREIDTKNVNEEIAAQFGLFSKNDEKILFHPAIAERIEKFVGAVINDAPTQDWLKAYDSLQNFWKGSVTSIFPAFHGRNAISNVFLNMMDLGVQVLNPVIHSQATQMLNLNRQYENLLEKTFQAGEVGAKATEDLHKLMTKEMFTDAHGYKWSFGELRQEISNRNVAFGRNILGSMDWEEGRKALVAVGKTTIKEKAGKVVGAPFKAGRAVGGAIEQQARLVNFIANLKNTGDVSLAAQRTKQFLFDYQALTPFEKNFMRRIMPFYTFTRKNLELQARSLLTTPGRTAAQFKAIDTLGDVFFGGSLTDEEKAALPDWATQGIGLLAERRGSTLTLMTGFGTPIEQPFQAFQPNQLLGSISPLVRTPIEAATGYSFFQGKMLSDVTNAAAFKSMPDVVKDAIGYTEIEGKRSDGTPFTWYVSLRPGMMNFMLNLPFARVLSATKQMQAVDVSNQYKVMQQLVGIRPYSFDVEQEAAKREREMREQLEDMLTKAGVTAKYKRVYVPKEGF